MIGIANTSPGAVLERCSEIGARRALAARRRHIAIQFLAESGGSAPSAGGIGAGAGIITVVAVSASRDLTTLNPCLPPRSGSPPAWFGAPARRPRITTVAALRSESSLRGTNQ